MSLLSYADLQTSIANFLARDDLSAYIPDFITLFECAAARKLKVRQQETTTTISTTNGVGTLPSDYLGFRRVTWQGSPTTELNYVTPPYFASRAVSITGVSNAGTPQMFTIEGSSLKLYPTDDTGTQIVYFQRTAALSGTLNWLYTNYPDVYLFGSLAEANAFNKAVDPAGEWKARRDEVFNEIAMTYFNERQNMAIRVMGHTP